MAYDRYSCICWPIKSCSWTSRRATVSIVLSWLAAVIVSAPQLYLFKVQRLRAREHEVETCSVKWPSKLAEGGYILFHLSTQFVLPLIVLIFFYSKIFITVSRSIRFKKDSLQTERSNNVNLETSLVADEMSLNKVSTTAKSHQRINDFNSIVDRYIDESQMSLNEPKIKKKRSSFSKQRKNDNSPKKKEPSYDSGPTSVTTLERPLIVSQVPPQVRMFTS
jgi:hypothetical protein